MKDQKDDEFIRNLFISILEVESHPSVEEEIAPRRNRSFEYAPIQATALINMMTTATVKNSDGNKIGVAPAFNLNDSRVSRFIERVSRGVIYDGFKLSYFPAEFGWYLKPSDPNFLDGMPTEHVQWKHVGDIFSYLVTPFSSNGTCIVLLMFYRKLKIVAWLRKKV